MDSRDQSANGADVDHHDEEYDEEHEEHDDGTHHIHDDCNDDDDGDRGNLLFLITFEHLFTILFELIREVHF